MRYETTYNLQEFTPTRTLLYLHTLFVSLNVDRELYYTWVDHSCHADLSFLGIVDGLFLLKLYLFYFFFQ